jgi:hypothetical protein
MCDAQGQLGVEEFEMVMREQILNYTMSRLSATSEYWSVSDQDFTELGTLKQLLMEQLSVKKELEATKRSLESVLGLLQSARKNSDACECSESYQALRQSRTCRAVHRKRRVSHDVRKEIIGKVDLLRVEILDILESVGLTDEESDGSYIEDESILPQDVSLGIKPENCIDSDSLIAAHAVDGLEQRQTTVSSSRPQALNKHEGMAIMTHTNSFFAYPVAESPFLSSSAALSSTSTVQVSRRPQSLCKEHGYGVKNCSKPIPPSPNSSSRDESHTISTKSQTHSRSSSSKSHKDEYPLTNENCISAGISQNLEQILNNGLYRDGGKSFPSSLHSGESITQQQYAGYDTAMFSDTMKSNPTSNHKINFSIRSISPTGSHRSVTHSSEFSQHPAQETSSRNGVLNLGVISCLPVTIYTGDIHLIAMDIPAYFATEWADGTESETIILNGSA